MDESMRVDDDGVAAAAAAAMAAAATAGNAGDAEAAPESAAMDETHAGAPSLPTSLNIVLPADLSAETLLSLIQTHTTQPTAALSAPSAVVTPNDQVILAVYSALASLSAKYTAECDARQALQIESESELNTAERLRADAEQQASEANRQREAAESTRQATENTLAETQSELASIKSNLESGNSESLQVKAVLEKEQREKREILQELDKERTQHNETKDDVESLTTRLRESRQEVNKLSTEAQELRASEGSMKFRLQSLSQELELAKKDAEWAHSELSRLNTEQTEQRTRKQQELLRIQAQYNEATQTLTSLESKADALQQALDDNTRRLSEVVREKEDYANRLASQEESFRREIETKDRLAALLERRAQDSQRRVEQIEGAWERVLEEKREQHDDIRAQLDRQSARVDEVEEEKQQLSLALDRLAESVGIDTASVAGSPRLSGTESVRSATPSVSTPRRPFAATSVGLGQSGGVGSNPAFAVSPTVALASTMQRSGKSFTQVYTTLAKTEEELRRSKVENQRLAATLEEVLADVRDRVPLIHAQRAETERLEVALEELSADFARACEDRDTAEQESRQSRAQSTALQRENSLITQQLADLARQVRALTREVIIRDDPAAAANLQDDGASDLNGGVSGGDVDQEQDIQSVISTQLVTFDSLTNLVAQNHRLLRVARQLGARMEEEEAKWRERTEREEDDATRQSARDIERLESELRTEHSKLEALRRERDMFRTMLSTRGAGSSSNGFAASGASAGADTSANNAALVNQLSTLQGQFDTFRDETYRDTEALKEEARLARDEAGKSALAAARERASKEATDERFRTLQRTFELQRAELPELQKRLQTQQEHAARLEATSHSLSENLTSTRTELDRLRNEAANLRAERDLVKGAEARLIEENQSMVREKAGLNELLRNVQSMQNDLDRNAGEVRRRLEGQVEKLEEQAKEYRARCAKEETARREADMRREVEVSSLQTRLDRLTSEHATAKEQLAVAKTSVEHLTRRSDDLQKQLEAKDDKLAVYERRPGGAGDGSSSSSATNAPSASATQALQIEIAELRAELRNARVEAEQSAAHVDQYKSIAQASEEALAELQTTYDQYKASTEASIAAKDAEIESLRQRLEGVTTEITTLQNEASQARQALESQRSEFAAEKRSLEDAIAELGTVEERAKAEQSDVREDIKKQAQLAREAHAKYENELLAHAEDIKALATIKDELERTRVEAREAQRTSETAQANIASSEASWQAQRDVLSREKDAMEQRISELSEQNNVLHQHLEKLSEQVTEIRGQGAGADAEGGDSSTAAAAVDPDASFSQAPTEKLQDVLKYLRREKEIVELQLNASKQEATRLRLGLEHANRALDETKLQLAEERERGARAGGSGGQQQHDELLEKINQLSILRESNATLRDESEKAGRRANTLEAQLNVARGELEPLKDQLRSVQNELAAAQGQLRIVQEDNQRWQARAQSILSQYDRIDPEDVKKLEERASVAEARVAEAEKQLETARSEVTSSKDQFQRLRTQANDRLKANREEITRLKAEVESITKARDDAAASATNATAASTAVGAEKDEALAQLRQQVEAVQSERDQARAAVSAGEERLKALEEQIAQLQQQQQQQQQSANAVTAESSGAEAVDAATAPETPAKAGESTDTAVATLDTSAAVAKALEEAQTAWTTEKATLEANMANLETREKQHHQKAREFLTGMRQAQKERDEAKKERDELEAKLAASSSGSANAGAGTDAAEKTEEGETVADVKPVDETAEELKKKIAELEEALQAANARIAELEAALQASSTSGTSGGDDTAAAAAHQQELEKLKAQHAEDLKAQSQQYQKRQSMAVDVAVKKAQNAAAGAWSTAPPTEAQIEAKVQERLAAIEAKNAAEKDDAVRAAVEAKIAELRAEFASSQPPSSSASVAGDTEASAESLKSKYDAGYEAGKSEAALRNQLMLKQRDGKIDKLQKEIAQLKAEAANTAVPGPSAAPVAPAAASNATNGGAAVTPPSAPTGAASNIRPAGAPNTGRGGGPAGAIRGGRGGGVSGAPASAQQQPGAGAAATRGRGGGAVQRGGASIRGASGGAIRGGAARGGARGGGVAGQALGGQKRKVSEDQGQPGGGAGGAGGAAAANAAKKPKGS